jgi:hypothetical protein
MPTCSYRQLEKVCAALGLQRKNIRNGFAWLGISPLNRKPVFLVVHRHAGVRNVPTGLFLEYVSQLGFQSIDHFLRYLKQRT